MSEERRLILTMRGAGLAEKTEGPDSFDSYTPTIEGNLAVALVDKERRSDGRWIGQLLLDRNWPERHQLELLELLPDLSRGVLVGTPGPTNDVTIAISDGSKHTLDRLEMSRSGSYVEGRMYWRALSGTAAGAAELVVTGWRWPPEDPEG